MGRQTPSQIAGILIRVLAREGGELEFHDLVARVAPLIPPSRALRVQENEAKLAHLRRQRRRPDLMGQPWRRRLGPVESRIAVGRGIIVRKAISDLVRTRVLTVDPWSPTAEDRLAQRQVRLRK